MNCGSERPSHSAAAWALELNAPADAQWLAEVAAEAIGWQPLGEGAYLHIGKPEAEEMVIHIVGVPDAGMAGMTVLWVGPII